MAVTMASSQSMMHNLGELYGQGLSTPSEDENTFARILREETKSLELAALAEQKLHFRVDQVIETDTEGRDFASVFGGWWKAATGNKAFDWDTWRGEALEKYGDGGFAPPAV